MLKVEYLKELLIISILLSTITCTFIQKTKNILKNKKYISIYSLAINIVLGIFFAKVFTTIKFPNSIWIGLLSFIGSDSIYKSIEGKLLTSINFNNKRK